METFLYLTDIQWGGLGVISTFLVSFIALFLPYFWKFTEKRSSVKKIKNELSDNYYKIENAAETKDNPVANKISVQLAIIEHVSLREWDSVKSEISSKDYSKFKEINESIQLMIDDRKEFLEKNNATRGARFQGALGSIVEKYNKKFKK